MDDTDETYDVAIVGAGPIGIATAVACVRQGLRCLLIDAGCLLDSLFRYPRNMTFFSTAERIAIAGMPFPCADPKPSRDQALHYYREIALQSGADLRLYSRVTGIDGSIGAFRCLTDTGAVGCRRVVLATGFFQQVVRLGIPGEDLPKCSHHFDDPHAFAGRDLVIVGGANSAVIAALDCWRFGARVTVVHRGSDFRQSVKYWLRPDIENRIAEGEIRVIFDATVCEVEADAVVLQTADGQQRLTNDHVLFLTGYRPDFTFLETCGIERDEDQAPLVDPDHYESRSRPGIHLAGCVLGGNNTSSIFIENARHHADAIAAHLAVQLSGRSSRDDVVVDG